MNDNGSKRRSVDERSADPEALKVAQVVRAIPEDVPSLAWRSDLNEKILAAAQSRRKRRRFARIWVPATGLGSTGLAALLAFMVWFGPAPDSRDVAPDGSLEAQMVAVHRENVGFGELAGSGLSVSDPLPVKQDQRTDVQWKEADLEAL